MHKDYIFYVYILTNYSKTVLYAGFINNIVRRIIEHKNDLGSEFTKKYNLKYLVYLEQFYDAYAAMEREKEIKRMRREEKLNMIRNANPNLNDLSSGIFKDCEIGEKEIEGIVKELKDRYKNQ